MTKESIDKRKVQTEAKKLLKQGTSKQETFTILKEKYRYSKEVADILKNIPSQAAQKKYAKWNYILLVLLIFTAALLYWPSPHYGTLIFYGLLIYVVANMLVKYYVWVTAFSSFAIISFLGVLLINNFSMVNWSSIIILAILLAPSLYLPIWLEKKLCPKPVEQKEEYTNSKGQKRLRVVYEFPDL